MPCGAEDVGLEGEAVIATEREDLAAEAEAIIEMSEPAAHVFRFVRQYGNKGVSLLALMLAGRDPVNIQAILQALSSMSHPETHDERLMTICGELHHAAPAVRIQAAQGLAYMGDQRAVPYLENAIARERKPEWAAELQWALELLKESA